MDKQPYSDELEKQIGIRLNECDIKFERNQRLDFYLPDYGVYLEVKKYHSERSVSQLASQENIVLIQGKEAVTFFCRALIGGLSKQNDKENKSSNNRPRKTRNAAHPKTNRRMEDQG